MKKYMKHNNIYVDGRQFYETKTGALSLKDSSISTQDELDAVQSELDTVNSELDLVNSMLSGDIVLAVSPVTLGSSAEAVNTAIAGDGFSRDVVITLKNTEGSYLPFNGTLPVSIGSSTDGDGVADIDSATTVTFVNGLASITINYTGTWTATDTCTLTVGNTSSILGYSVANKTSIDTLVA